MWNTKDETPVSQPRVSKSLRSNDRYGARRAGMRCRSQSVAVFDRHAEPFHQRAHVFREALLSRHERVAVMVVFHVADFQIRRRADVVMRPENEARPFAAQKILERRDFCGRRFFFATMWSRPNIMSVSVSAKMRSSIGSLWPA